MNFLDLINELDSKELNGESKDRFLSRKQALGKLTNFSKKLAVTALPLGAMAAFSNEAQAQSTTELASVLNFALTLEYLENEYYQMGLNASGLIPDGDPSSIYTELAANEQAHVNFLKDVISNVLQEEPVPKPIFDFTGAQSENGGGPFKPFEDYQTFLTLSQAFEDTGVRAYKGQAGAVQGNDLVLTRALQIHSVEARHASRVRELRGLNGWISGGPGDQQVPEAAQAVYKGATPETNTTQLVDVLATRSGDGDVDEGDIAEAWDEPLTMDEVLAIGGLFIVPEE